MPVRAVGVAGAGRAVAVGGDSRRDREGGRVAVEAECFIPLDDRCIYGSTHHFLVAFRDDKVQRVAEYYRARGARCVPAEPMAVTDRRERTW